ncbi:Endonuclease/exonuclease/phosphatase [Pseudomassariella vexata]|uniref:Endonuclease/exonuclease/phosphatase n=1 Tax=Pseudomassariella vexata TaxID=1141098 RepID=A0A1Y2E6V5_9PEZI|nr:Endonuclease/exonuclease/phosphatase [Pseudomassariella vexata]ORY67290.1 Endonuclease/exonuclease/phosphatase [Pseudomassariella vexata]
MRPPMLDLFYLTFNAGKNLISVPVFANHLHNAFGQNATTLPELVLISLQEMAPLSSAFIGSYWLSPYFSRYESALNLAAAKFIAEEERQHRPKDKAYTLVKMCNVGMTGIMLFARDKNALHNIKSAEVGFGAGDMANKGAVGLRMDFEKDGKETELTFVSTHLAAMEWNLERRNRNWESIVSGLVFVDPKQIMQSETSQHAENRPEENRPEDRPETDAQPLLAGFHPSTEKALHDISIYKPGSHLFVAGDLNYRLSKTSPPIDATFPGVDPDNEDFYPRFLARDQLTAEKKAGRTLHGLTEAEIHFPPTYKYIILPKGEPETELSRIAAEEGDGEEIKWKFASHRWPGWCDRVLYADVPQWVAGDHAIIPTAYNCLPVVRSSDHRAVFLRALVPVLSPDELAPAQDVIETALREAESGVDGRKAIDPRIKPPFVVSVDSWEHRAAVKKWERMVGWSMVISKSKQGIMVFVTVLLVGLGAWWYGNVNS